MPLQSRVIETSVDTAAAICRVSAGGMGNCRTSISHDRVGQSSETHSLQKTLSREVVSSSCSSASTAVLCLFFNTTPFQYEYRQDHLSSELACDPLPCTHFLGSAKGLLRQGGNQSGDPRTKRSFRRHRDYWLRKSRYWVQGYDPHNRRSKICD